MSNATPTASGERASRRGMPWAILSLLLALIGSAGSLALSLWLELKACPLCFYQRTFMLGVVGVLLIGLLAGRRQAGLLCLLALPLSFGGLTVAGFHESLVLREVLECPLGVTGMLTAPLESLLLFAALLLANGAGAWVDRGTFAAGSLSVLATAIVGAALGYGCIASSTAPPPAKPPDGKPLDGCRMVWKG